MTLGLFALSAAECLWCSDSFVWNFVIFANHSVSISCCYIHGSVDLVQYNGVVKTHVIQCLTIFYMIQESNE